MTGQGGRFHRTTHLARRPRGERDAGIETGRYIPEPEFTTLIDACLTDDTSAGLARSRGLPPALAKRHARRRGGRTASGRQNLPARRLTVRQSKGMKDRTVFMTDTTVQAVREYLAVCGARSAEHVFLYRNAPLSKCLIDCRIKAAGERVGVKVYPHRLRHTCATQLLNAGCRITSIQKYLGHKKLNTTMIYAQVLDQTMANDYFMAMQKIEKQLILPIIVLNRPPSTSEMLNLVESLFKSTLDPMQYEVVSILHKGLTCLAKNNIEYADITMQAHQSLDFINDG